MTAIVSGIHFYVLIQGVTSRMLPLKYIMLYIPTSSLDKSKKQIRKVGLYLPFNPFYILRICDTLNQLDKQKIQHNHSSCTYLTSTTASLKMK